MYKIYTQNIYLQNLSAVSSIEWDAQNPVFIKRLKAFYILSKVRQSVVYLTFHERKHTNVQYINLLYNYNNENIIVDI
jgi:hypothetical protein